MVVERALVRGLEANNRRLARAAHDAGAPNPRPTAGLPWVEDLVAAHPTARAEWDAFVAGGGRLPRLGDLLDEDQGEDGTWRAGLLVSQGRSVPALADRFPATLAALDRVPGMWSALWSVLGPGTELPEHCGPNGGVLRLHLGIDCPPDTGLAVDGTIVPYRDGEVVLFDDTAPHAAWNRSARPRTTLFCEVLRPAGGATRAANLAIQRALARDHRYRSAPGRAAEWDAALNGTR